MTEIEREQRLGIWQLAPHACFCQPREEHLLPLHVYYGVAGRACDEVYSLSTAKQLVSCIE